MKKKKLFIAITLSNYLIDRTGTPKVVMSHQVAANDAGIKYVALFPIGGSSKFAKRLFSNSFGVICDGKFAGVFSLEAFLARVGRLLDGEYELGCIYIHHFMGWNLESIAGIVSSYPKVQLVVYAHDYYLCCTNYNLIQDSTQLCGSARLGDAQCAGCAYYADSIIREDCIWRLLHNELHRIVFACPSSVVERMVQSFHPEARGHCTVIPHQRYVGIYLDNKEVLPPNHTIKVAYLGKQQSIKGWDCWCRLVDAFRGQGKYEFVVFNNETKPLPSGMRRVFVEFSPGKPNAMIDELRRENVDAALLWSQCLETYSYTCMEAYASNAFIITCPSSGNIAEFVSMTHCGQVLSSEQELCQLLDEPDKLLELLNGFRANHDGGAMALATNDAFIALAKPSMPTAQNAVENERQCRTYRFRLDNCFSLPLRIFYSCRERKKNRGCKFTETKTRVRHMSILEKKTGSGIDALIISLIMAKVFLLEYLGMAGIVNNVIFLLIGVRLIFSGWKIPKKLLFLVCLITMLLVLSYSAGSIVPGKTSYNLKAIQTFLFYALFIVMLKTNGSDLLDFGKQRWIVFFNVVYAVNCIVILIQVYYPYSLMAAAPMTGQIPFYEDLISGLFMYASTHAVALFSCFVLLIDLNSIRDGSGELRIPVVCCAAAVLASSLGIAALNDNKALFALMPIVLLLFYAEGLSSINFMRIAKGLMFLAVLLGIVFLLYICNSSFANFFDDNVLSLFDLVESSSSIGTDAVGSGERIAIIGYALNLASSWLFGIGLGAATFHEGAFCGFTHFGQADFGSLVILLGVWFLIALFAFYVFCVSCGCRGRRPYVLYLSLVALAATATIYTQCFTRANNALLFLLIGLALVERWKSIAQSTSVLSKE